MPQVPSSVNGVTAQNQAFKRRDASAALRDGLSRAASSVLPWDALDTTSASPSSSQSFSVSVTNIPASSKNANVVVLVAQSCPTLCDPMNCSPPGSSVHEPFQARILEWVAISFSRGSSQPRDQTRISCTAGRFFSDWAIREALRMLILQLKKKKATGGKYCSHLRPIKDLNIKHLKRWDR